MDNKTIEKDYIIKKSNITFNDIVGQKDAVKEFKNLIKSIRYKDIYRKWDVNITKGILLVGDTGLGKTMSVKALSNELGDDVILIELRYLDIASKWVDGLIESLKTIFNYINEKSKEKHIIIFIDEIDSMLPNRNMNNIHEASIKRVGVFLEWMDGGLNELDNVTIIGATNNEDGIDKAIKRAGRFDKIIEFKPLSKEDILKGLKVYADKSSSIIDKNIDWDSILVDIKDGMFNGADLKEIINRIKSEKVNEHIENLNNNINKMPNPISEKDIKREISIYFNTRNKENKMMRIGYAY